MAKLRFAYYLIATSSEFRALRDDSCSPFPEHITIRGRFLASRSKLADLVVIGREAFRNLAPFTAELRGPHSFPSGLTWYELTPESGAFPAIRSLHRQLDRELLDHRLVAVDEVPAEYRGDGYVPHMTISFHGLPEQRLSVAPPSVQVSFVEWGLFRYDDWGARPRLRCVFGEHLYGKEPLPLFVPAAACIA